MAFNPVLLAAMSDVEPTEAGLASGVVNTSFMMGGALGLAVLASLAASRTDTLLASGESQAEALTGGYHVAFLVGALFAITAAAIGGLLLRRARTQASTAAGGRSAARGRVAGGRVPDGGSSLDELQQSLARVGPPVRTTTRLGAASTRRGSTAGGDRALPRRRGHRDGVRLRPRAPARGRGSRRGAQSGRALCPRRRARDRPLGDADRWRSTAMPAPRVQGGATWLDFDSATQAFGLVAPGGSSARPGSPASRSAAASAI